MKYLSLVSILISTVFVLQGCDLINEKCETVDSLPDLNIPIYIPTNFLSADGSWKLLDEYRPCYVNSPTLHPNGFPITVLPGAYNEFYSLERFDFINNSPIVFYWSPGFFPPFDANEPNPVYHPMQIGEKFHVHKFITNLNVEGTLCDILQAGQSLTKSKMRFKVENGEIVEAEKISITPSILPGAMVPITMTYEFEGPGFYFFDFEANFDRQIEERDTTNNYVEVRTEIDD